MPDLITKRLNIRPIAQSDMNSFLAILGDEDVMEFSDNGPLNAEDVSAWVTVQIKDYVSTPEFGTWAITGPERPEAIGYVSLTRDVGRTAPGETELGFRLAPHAWGKGYASEAARSVIHYAFTHTDTQRLIAIVDPHNLRSLRVIERVGMSFHSTIMFDGYDYPDHVFELLRSPR